MSLGTFEPNCLKELQGARFNLRSENSLVILSFVTHVLNPTTYPLFDQHVNRAMLVLSNRTAQVTQNRSLLVEDWIEYETFWRRDYISYIVFSYLEHVGKIESQVNRTDSGDQN